MGIGLIADKVIRHLNHIVDAFSLGDDGRGVVATEADVAAQYKKKASYTDFLPFVEYLPEHECFLMDDMESVAAIWDIAPVPVEGFSEEYKEQIRNDIMSVLSDNIPRDVDNPFIAQVYFDTKKSLKEYMPVLRDYVKKGVEENSFTQEYLSMWEKHLKDVCQSGGLFDDRTVTGIPWGGQVVIAKLVLFKKQPSNLKKTDHDNPFTELSRVREMLEGAMKQVGIPLSRYDGAKYYEWMFRWHNPCPDISGGDVDKALDMAPYPGDEGILEGGDLSEQVCLSSPRSDGEKGIWYFDEQPHQMLQVEMITSKPQVGAISAPTGNRGNISALFDKMGEGVVFVMTIVFQHEDVVRTRAEKLASKAIGVSVESGEAAVESQFVEKLISRRQPLLPVEMAFYVTAKNEKELQKVKTNVRAVASTAKLRIIKDEDDHFAVDSYLRLLPGCYRWDLQKLRNRTRYYTFEHIANLMPIYGRPVGTGSACLTAFNRGGTPYFFDVLGKEKQKNGHMLIFGPTGAGKSAKSVEMLLSYIAMYDARVFIAEVGESFSPVMEYLKAKGKSTNSVILRRGKGANIPPYANAFKALEYEEKTNREQDICFDTVEMMKDNSGSEDENKDYLGEMEILTRIIVTGGNADRNKNITLTDQSLIRRSILNAARYCRDNEINQVKVEHVAQQMGELLETDQKMPESVKERCYEYREALLMFCEGLAGEVFNNEGQLWPEVDVTHIDLADTARAGNESSLAVAYLSVMNMVNDIAEREQNSGRPIIFLTDEAHNITKNPLLAPAAVKIVKMWRKLGAWYWMATQNMADFPDEAGAILSLCEWWYCLTMDEAEVEEISRFRTLTDEQKHMMISTSKQKYCYSEAVVLPLNELHRNVPPSLVLALAMSEQDEKEERNRYMREHNCTFLEAIHIVASGLDKSRGITS